VVKDLMDSFSAFNWFEEEGQIARSSAWSKFFALWRRIPASSATNKEGGITLLKVLGHLFGLVASIF